MIKQVNKENKELWDKAYKTIQDAKVLVGVSGIDDVFSNSVVRGGLYMFSACRGTGKTTVLLALAKKLANDGKKVLFITTEQSIEQVAINIQVNENLYVGDTGQDIMGLTIDDGYDYIMYDYIGSEEVDLSQWAGLINVANSLAEKAKELEAVIFTCCQADDKLEEQYRNDNSNASLFTGLYISFSKHIADKISGGAYLLKDGTLINYKNRYGCANLIGFVKLDHEKKEFLCF